VQVAKDERAVLTVEEAARVLGVAKNTLYEAIQRGEVPHVRLGRLIRVPRHALEVLLKGQGGDATS
jgi:excisionase family DNA binding protein